MKMFRCAALALALALTACMARAQFTFDCVPDTPITHAQAGAKIGTASVKVETAAGEAEGWFCELPRTASTPAGKTQFKRVYRYTLFKHEGKVNLAQMWARVKAAPDFMAAVNAEAAARSITTVAGTQDDYDKLLLLHMACVKLLTPPYLIPNMDTPAPNTCGPVPTPPPQDPWRTPAVGKTIFTFANGRITGQTVRKAPGGMACNCAITVKIGATTFCSIGVPTEVTECIKP